MVGVGKGGSKGRPAYCRLRSRHPSSSFTSLFQVMQREEEGGEEKKRGVSGH